MDARTVRWTCALGVFAVCAVAQAAPPPFVPSPDLQHDVIAHDIGAIGLQVFFDEMSWTSFNALNWPAAAGARGIPDRDNLVGGRPPSAEGGGGMPNGPTVWETYKNTNDVFLNPPVAPPPWSTPDRVPSFCTVKVAPGTKVMTIHNEAFSVELNDQKGKNVWYEVRINQREFDFIVQNQYYDSRKQPPVITFPVGSNQTAEVGPVHVKAAWKELTPAEAASGRFYVNSALLVDPKLNPPCRFVQSMGLVGLHIVHKTASRPEWVWSTFEQIDNAPDVGATPRQAYSFYNPVCANCKVNQPPATPTTPTQVERVTPVDSAAKGKNDAYQAYFASASTSKVKNVWQYYQLVNAQWPAEPQSVATYGHPVPTFLANTVLETYFQPPVKADPPHSCMDCHGEYTMTPSFTQPFGTTDFYFQLTKACPAAQWCQSKHPVAAIPPGLPKAIKH